MKRIWIILGAVVCCVAAVCIWLLMSKEEMQPLPLPEDVMIDQYNGISMKYCNGEKVAYLNLNEEQQEELLNLLRSARSKPAQVWSADRAKMPAYEVKMAYVDSGRYELLHLIYMNGYLVFEDGNAYRVNLDLKQFVKKHDLLSEDKFRSSIYALDCIRWFAWKQDGWNSKYLPLAEEPKGQGNVTIELNEWTDETITYTVNAEYGWSKGNGAFHLHVKLDDQWHKVLPNPGRGAEALPLISVGPGVYEETVSYADKYGTLPPGQYRFEIGDLSFEHTIE